MGNRWGSRGWGKRDGVLLVSGVDSCHWIFALLAGVCVNEQLLMIMQIQHHDAIYSDILMFMRFKIHETKHENAVSSRLI